MALPDRLHDRRLKAVLDRQSAATLNVDKCIFSAPKIKFLGNVVSANLPAPSNNVHDVRIFLGMVNHMGKFAEHLADKTKPLRDLMQKGSQWIWAPPQELAFQEMKSSLTKAPILALYDPNRETKISADASFFGLGGVLLQKQDAEHSPSWSVDMRKSKKKAFVLTWACERCSDYIVGKSIIAETDHKPLVSLLTKCALNDVPPRIQRLRMRLMRFHLKEVIHVPGKEMYVADALSRIHNQF